MIAVDDHTLKVKLRRPTPHFLFMLMNPTFAPFPGDVFGDGKTIESNEDGYVWIPGEDFVDPKSMVFNGPYRLHRAYEMGGDLYLIANEHYWNADLVGCKRVKMAMFKTGNAAYEAYTEGRLDWLPGLYGSAAAEADRGERADLLVTPQVGTYYYEFNCRPTIDGKPNAFADPALRRALAHLFDRDAMVKAVSIQVKPLGTFIPPGTMPGQTRPAVHVTRTVPGFPGHTHLRVDDMILSVNGMPMPENAASDTFGDIVQQMTAGEQITFEVLRDGKVIKRTMTLASSRALRGMFPYPGDRLQVLEMVEQRWQQRLRQLKRDIKLPKQLAPEK